MTADTTATTGATSSRSPAWRTATSYLQGVHMLCDGTHGEAWGDADRTSKLVFIGRNLDRAQLSDGLRACLMTA